MAGTPDFANWVLYLATTCTEEDSLRPFHEALANLTIDEEEVGCAQWCLQVCQAACRKVDEPGFDGQLQAYHLVTECGNSLGAHK